MPLKYTQVEARPVGLYLALLASGASTAPSTVTATVATAGAAADVNAIPVDSLSAAIPKNTVLTFSRAAGSPDSITVVTTADAAASATSLSVEMYDGADGDGLTYALADDDAATWDGLYTVVGTEDSPYSNNEQTNDLSAIVYGSSSAINVSTPQTTSMAPTISRTGLFLSEGQLTQDVIQYAGTNRNWWAKQITPDADSNAWMQREGLCRVRNLSQPQPADGLIRLNFDIVFVASVPTTTFPGVA